MTVTAAAPRGDQPVAAIGWMLGAALSFAITYIFVRELSKTYTVFEIVLLRQVFGILFMVPWAVRAKVGLYPRSQFGMHLLRAVLIYAAVFASYASVTLIALADSMALQFTLPLFTSILAVLLLGEKAAAHRWIAVGAGFAGALLIIRPGFAVVEIGMLAALAAAAFYGAGDVTTRFLSRTFPTAAIIFYGTVMQFPVSVAVAIPGWVTPTLAEAPLILAFAVAAFLSQWCLTRAYGLADASLVSPVLFARLPFIAAMAWLIFGEATDVWTWAGAAIIFASTTWSARQETRAARAAAAT